MNTFLRSGISLSLLLNCEDNNFLNVSLIEFFLVLIPKIFIPVIELASVWTVRPHLLHTTCFIFFMVDQCIDSLLSQCTLSSSKTSLKFSFHGLWMRIRLFILLRLFSNLIQRLSVLSVTETLLPAMTDHRWTHSFASKIKFYSRVSAYPGANNVLFQLTISSGLSIRFT